MNRKHFFSMLICVSMAVSGCGTKKMIDVLSIPSEDAEQTVTDEQKINVLLEETPAELFVYDITDGELYIYGMYDSGLESLVIPNEIEGCPGGKNVMPSWRKEPGCWYMAVVHREYRRE